MLNVAVCVKSVPHPAAPPRLDPAHGTLDRQAAVVLDDADACGLEMALQVVEAARAGSVTLVSMGPHRTTEVLRRALAMGGGSATLVSDHRLAGSDALSTAKVLAAALRGIGPDLIFTGSESSDGYTGTVASQLAELLDLPALTSVGWMEVSGRVVKAGRRSEEGAETVEAVLPAVVSIHAGAVPPRFPSFSGVLASRSKPVSYVDLGDLGLSPCDVGWAGARQAVVAIEPEPQRRRGETVEDRGDAHLAVIALLERLAIL